MLYGDVCDLQEPLQGFPPGRMDLWDFERRAGHVSVMQKYGGWVRRSFVGWTAAAKKGYGTLSVIVTMRSEKCDG